MATTKPLVLLDPHPRTRQMIFADDAWARLARMAELVTGDTGPVDAGVVDECLPRVCAIVGQTPMPEARLRRASALRAIFNVEGNFLPNVDYAFCFRCDSISRRVLPFWMRQPAAGSGSGRADWGNVHIM